ncbi:hypothetical protein GCM10009590_19430 [Brachybacterium alimentarium]
MARKNYSEEFRRQAVDLYESTPGATLRGTAEDLGIVRGKREGLRDAACFTDELSCRRKMFRWLTRYNTKRRHSWCRYLSPNAYERAYTATLALAA